MTTMYKLYYARHCWMYCCMRDLCWLARKTLDNKTHTNIYSAEHLWNPWDLNCYNCCYLLLYCFIYACIIFVKQCESLRGFYSFLFSFVLLENIKYLLSAKHYVDTRTILVSKNETQFLNGAFGQARKRSINLIITQMKT